MNLVWGTCQFGLAGIIILGIVLADGNLETGSGGDERPCARVEWEGNGAPVWKLAFAGSTRLAASSTSNEVRLIDLATGQARRLPGESCGHDQSLAFSPGGQFLAIGGRGPDVWLWDVEAGIEREPLKAGTGEIRCVAFAPDGTKLAVGTSESESRPATVTLWEWPARRRLAELDSFPGSIFALAFSPDGRRMVIADASGRVLLWDVVGRQELRSLAGAQVWHRWSGGFAGRSAARDVVPCRQRRQVVGRDRLGATGSPERPCRRGFPGLLARRGIAGDGARRRDRLPIRCRISARDRGGPCAVWLIAGGRLLGRRPGARGWRDRWRRPPLERQGDSRW